MKQFEEVKVPDEKTDGKSQTASTQKGEVNIPCLNVADSHRALGTYLLQKKFSLPIVAGTQLQITNVINILALRSVLPKEQEEMVSWSETAFREEYESELLKRSHEISMPAVLLWCCTAKGVRMTLVYSDRAQAQVESWDLKEMFGWTEKYEMEADSNESSIHYSRWYSSKVPV